MWLVGQSLLLTRGRLSRAVATRDPTPLLARARRQITSGADALDLNAGIEADPVALAWATRVIRGALPGVPLWLDAARPEALVAALNACTEHGTSGPLVANALGVGPGAAEGGAALIEACAPRGAGLVISPRGFDSPLAPASAERLAGGALEAAGRARAGGVSGPILLDALAWPPATDAGRCERSLAVLRLLRATPDARPLVAVGNTGHGLPPGLAREVRRLYAAAATAAGAGALILAVEEASTVRAVRVAQGEAFPADVAEAYLATFGEAVAVGEQPHPPPAPAGAALREAWRLLFQA